MIAHLFYRSISGNHFKQLLIIFEGRFFIYPIKMIQ